MIHLVINNIRKQTVRVIKAFMVTSEQSRTSTRTTQISHPAKAVTPRKKQVELTVFTRKPRISIELSNRRRSIPIGKKLMRSSRGSGRNTVRKRRILREMRKRKRSFIGNFTKAPMESMRTKSRGRGLHRIPMTSTMTRSLFSISLSMLSGNLSKRKRIRNMSQKTTRISISRTEAFTLGRIFLGTRTSGARLTRRCSTPSR